MKKILFSLILSAFVLSLGTVALAAETKGKAKSPARALDTTCAWNAVDKRETSILAAFDTRYNSTKVTIQKRNDSQKTAWQMAEAKDRRVALRKVWTDYSAAMRKVTREWQTNRANAWKQFTTDRRACGPTAASEDGNVGASVDAQL